MKKLILALMLLSATADAQTCAYQDACFIGTCDFCYHVGAAGNHVPAHGVMPTDGYGLICISKDPHETQWVDCTWCYPATHSCSHSFDPWGTTNGHATICEMCWGNPETVTAALCLPWHCDDENPTDCNIVECSQYCI